jgi:hypothetical protein
MTIKNITGFPGYSISTDGTIISNRKGNNIALKPTTTNGYKKVTLSKDGKRYHFQLHRLVAQTFLNEPQKNFTIVNHKDGNKLNCALSNLEWTCRKGNAQHYEREIKPKLKLHKLEKKNEDAMMRLKIIAVIKDACKDNHLLFNKLTAVVLDGCVV